MARQYRGTTSADGAGTSRRYAQIIGVVLLVTALIGFVLGDEPLFGILNIDVVEDVVHLITGGLMAYVGFALRDNAALRTVVGGLGVVYLLVGVLGFITPMLFGLMPHGYSIFDNLLHLALGILGIVIGFVVPRNAPTRP